MTLPEHMEPGWDSRDGAGGDSNHVVDELVAERNADVHQLHILLRLAETRRRDEEIQEPGALAVPPEGIAATRDPRHDGLGHAGRKRGRDRRVGGGPAVLEDLQTRIRSGGVTRGDPWP